MITDTAGPTQNDAPRDRASTSTTGIKGADNAATQSWSALQQKNVLDRQRWATRQDLRISITTWIEHTYYRHRRQHRLSPLTPIKHETTMTTTTPAAD